MTALDAPKVADLYLEGIDQFTGWFQSSLMTSVALRGHAPFRQVFFVGRVSERGVTFHFRSLFAHGFTVDANNRKMSKSLGNVIHPKDMIVKYGTDTLRWWTAAHSTQHASIVVSDSLLAQSAETIQRIRKVLRYLVGCLETDRKVHDLNFDTQNLFLLDKMFLNSLVEFNDEVTEAYNSYQYNRVTSTILNFVANELSAMYLHTVKDRFYCGTKNERDDVQKVLRSALYVLNKTLWPITPYVVEECWSYHGKSA